MGVALRLLQIYTCRNMSISEAAVYLRRRVYDQKVLGRSRCRNAAAWLPLLLQDEQQKTAGLPKPDCFGKAFDAEQDPKCTSCPVQVSCLHRCAHVTLPKAQAEAQSHAKRAVAEQSGWSLRQVHIMQQICCLTGAMRSTQVNAKVPSGTVPSIPSKRWPRRFMQERRRLPHLGYLPSGTRLVRKYAGVPHIVTVLDGTYFYDGEYYPTLYSVASAITGYKEHQQASKPGYRRLMGNYSARKFFGAAIEKAMPTV